MAGQVETLTRVLRDIRLHCRDCMGGQGGGGARCKTATCRLHQYATAPVQVDMYDGVFRDAWICGGVELAASAGSWWWSDLRRAVERTRGGPGHPSWWGGLASGLRKAGWSQVERRRCDAIAQRNKAIEWRWECRREAVAV
jgi:hypothetical protein